MGRQREKRKAEREGIASHPPGTDRWKEWDTVLTGGAFLLFLMISCHGLNHSSLWFDETIEYWYSKVMFGTLPFSNTETMYQRIITTLQPPLYNFLLYFWLLVSDSQWWFRFFGVVCGFFGMAALYRCVRRYAGSAAFASFAVAAASCVFRLTFYWQEAAEYCLMLGTLFWTVWFWFRTAEEPSRRNLILFTLSAILPVYSQYGAAFPVLAMAGSLPVVFVLRKNWQAFRELALAYGCALLAAGIPLYYFFLRYQLSFQHGGGVVHAVEFHGGFVRDCLVSFHRVFRWCLLPDYSAPVTWFLLALILACIALIIFRGSWLLRLFTLVNLADWFFYYFAVKLGVYADMSYGGFGNRYNLFFLPLWLIWGFLALPELYRMAAVLSRKLPPCLRKQDLPRLMAGCTVCLIAGTSLLSWKENIQPNWEKDNIREVVYRWYQEDAQNTVVYYAADAGFAYYLRVNPEWTEVEEEHVEYMPWMHDRTAEEYRAWLEGIYGGDLPRELYLAATHYEDDLFTILDVFLNAGYERRDIYNYGDSCLLCFRKR